MLRHCVDLCFTMHITFEGVLWLQCTSGHCVAMKKSFFSSFRTLCHFWMNSIDPYLQYKTFRNLRISQLDITFYHGFIASFSVIVVSELGDKTWFIAVIMAMRHSRYGSTVVDDWRLTLLLGLLRQEMGRRCYLGYEYGSLQNITEY